MNYLQLTNPRQHALLRNTCSMTRLEGSSKVNVVLTEAVLEIDCRQLPDQDPDAFIDELALIVNDPNITIEKLMGYTPAACTATTNEFRYRTCAKAPTT